MAMVDQLPRILWVAARPPVPPLFSGGAIRAQSAISLLSSVTEVELLTFAPADASADLADRFRRFWSDSPVSLHLIAPGQSRGAFEALRRGRLQSSFPVEDSALGERLEALAWDARETLVVFDDLIFAPLLPRYGRNALFSPNDCVSAMFRSHFQLAASPSDAFRSWVQHRIARRYESEFYHHALLTHVVTERDRFLLQEVNPRARYHVAPYADAGLLTSSAAGDAYAWDVAVWADLAIASSRRGTRELLAALAADPAWRHLRVALIGRVPAAEAERLLGRPALGPVEYSSFLEDAEGQMRRARVTVVPDVGGTGIKSRCLGLLASRQCVACLYSQMEGIHGACDLGAVNAASPQELVARIGTVLRQGLYEEIAAAGHDYYLREFGEAVLRRKWTEMVRRAVVLRGDSPPQPPPSRPAERRSERASDPQALPGKPPEVVVPLHAKREV